MSRRAARGLSLLLLALAAGCSNQPVTAPLVGGGSATVDLRFVAGALALAGEDGGRGAAAACDPAPTGFPTDLTGRIVITAASGTTTTTAFEIPARTETTTLLIDGLAPGNGYRAAVDLSSDESAVFEGESTAFAVLPGGLTPVAVELLPQDRRAVIGLGPASLLGAEEIVIPVYAANSLAVRGIEFDLCFDPAVLTPATTQPVGPRVTGFRAAAGEPSTPGVLRAVLWSEQSSAAIGPGADPVLELHFIFAPGVTPGTTSRLVFLSSIVTDAPENAPFEVYHFDAQVAR
jgi:hypothetical protein